MIGLNKVLEYENELEEEQASVRIPVENKLNLTVIEAAEYSNIGQNKIVEMLRNPMCDFVLKIGKRRLVKRKEFERFLSGRREI